MLIHLHAATNTRALNGVDPAKQKLRGQATSGLMETYMQRSADKSLRWTLTNFPCPAFAQEADMSLKDYEDFVYSATYADVDDPVAEWQRIHTEQQRIVDWLIGKKIVTVKSPNADLTLSIEGRTFINSDGKKNMPSGEVFTGPVEDFSQWLGQFHLPGDHRWAGSGRCAFGVQGR